MQADGAGAFFNFGSFICSILSTKYTFMDFLQFALNCGHYYGRQEDAAGEIVLHH